MHIRHVLDTHCLFSSLTNSDCHLLLRPLERRAEGGIAQKGLKVHAVNEFTEDLFVLKSDVLFIFKTDYIQLILDLRHLVKA